MIILNIFLKNHQISLPQNLAKANCNGKIFNIRDSILAN